MTLIAHGVLALDAAIKKKKFEKAQADYAEENAFENQQKKHEKYKKAIQRLKSLKRFEGDLNEFAQFPLEAVGIETKYKETPIALEKFVLSAPAVAIVGIVALVSDGVKSVIDTYKERETVKKEKVAADAAAKARAEEQKKKEQKSIEHKAAAIRAQKEQDAVDNAEETVEEEEIQAIEKIIQESRIVDFHTTDITKDKSALVKGLTNKAGKVINIDDSHIVFLYNFTNNPAATIVNGGHEASVFFINPKTGNYEQVAKFHSKRGMERLKRAVNAKLNEMERNSQRRIQAQQMQQEILQSQGRK